MIICSMLLIQAENQSLLQFLKRLVLSKKKYYINNGSGIQNAHDFIDMLSNTDKEMKMLKISWQVWQILCILFYVCLMQSLVSKGLELV